MAKKEDIDAAWGIVVNGRSRFVWLLRGSGFASPAVADLIADAAAVGLEGLEPEPPVDPASPVAVLARAFVARMREALMPAELEEALRRNDFEADPNVDHTHDFVDANEVMADAWRDAFGEEPDTYPFDGPESEMRTNLWNDAWGIAQAARYDPAALPAAPAAEPLKRPYTGGKSIAERVRDGALKEG